MLGGGGGRGANSRIYRIYVSQTMLLASMCHAIFFSARALEKTYSLFNK